MYRHIPCAALALGLLAALGAPGEAAERAALKFRALHDVAASSSAEAPLIADLHRAARRAKGMSKKAGYRFLAEQVEKAAALHRDEIPEAAYQGLRAVLAYAAQQAGESGFFHGGFGKARDAMVVAVAYARNHAEDFLAGGRESFRRALGMGAAVLPEYGAKQSRWMIQAMAARFSGREDLVPNAFSRAMLRATAEVAGYSDDKVFHFALKRPYNILIALELDARSYAQMAYLTADYIRGDVLANKVMRRYLAGLPAPPHAGGAEAIAGFAAAQDHAPTGAAARREQAFALLQYLHYGEATFEEFCALPLQMPFETKRLVFGVEMLPGLFSAFDPARIPAAHRDAVAEYVAAGNGIALRAIAVEVALNKEPCGPPLPWGYYYR